MHFPSSRHRGCGVDPRPTPLPQDEFPSPGPRGCGDDWKPSPHPTRDAIGITFVLVALVVGQCIIGWVFF